ncbi:cytidine deaminase [Adhaeretor mobilis]|uniref:Cytidine deaminase n=1 Tax=Adhaeretor mobilis TaxID=1930276 RepID=A0A517MUX4_9BACT|nr:cytidine deaminase [Adhaeretor mobilis]QDS98676.1 Cytidine deaminase [Adhaeretor mobilis]
MDDQQKQSLVAAAVEARANAYAPYSKFHVGAAVLTASGEIHSGCNVENASYGLTICAERIAAGAAVAAGGKKITAVAVATPGGHSPCGACRQFLAEFGGAMTVLLIDSDDPTNVNETSLDTLLPRQFEFPLKN